MLKSKVFYYDISEVDSVITSFQNSVLKSKNKNKKLEISPRPLHDPARSRVFANLNWLVPTKEYTF